jgi:hypothetical protein
MGIGVAVIAVALLAQFYPKKLPQNRELLLGCIALYPFFPCLINFLSFAGSAEVGSRSDSGQVLWNCCLFLLVLDLDGSIRM